MAQAGAKLSLLTDRRFWVAAAERSIFTGAQVVLAQLVVFSTEDVAAGGIGALPWTTMSSVAFFAVFVSVVTSIAKLGTGNEGPGITECLPEKKCPPEVTPEAAPKGSEGDVNPAPKRRRGSGTNK